MRTRSELLAFIDSRPALRALLAEVARRADGDPGHDLDHVLRVALWTVRIGGDALFADEAVAAALLHDLVNVPKSSPDRSRASELCAEAARPLLRAEGFSEEATERVTEAIRDHSFSRGASPVHPLARALQDADRLEALGAIGVFRTLSTGVLLGARYFHPDDPWARHRALDDKAWSVDHFFTKLLRLPATMLTAAGRREAERRAAFMRALLEQLGDEVGESPPE